jgi:hypothetical protein
METPKENSNKQKKKKKLEYLGNIRQVPSIVLFISVPFIRIDLLAVIQYITVPHQL